MKSYTQFLRYEKPAQEQEQIYSQESSQEYIHKHEWQSAMNYKQYPTRQSLIGVFTFLILGLPFGILSFVVTLSLLCLSLATLVIGIGIPLLMVTLMIARGFAFIERSMVHSLLGISIPVYEKRKITGSFKQRFFAYLADPLSWTSLIYALLVKFPLGLISFVLALVLPIVSFACTFFPLVYLLNLLIDTILLANHLPANSILIPLFVEIHQGAYDPVMFAHSFVGIPFGLVLGFVSYSVLRSLAQGNGLLVQAMLTPAYE